ncbi:hypothetical protein DPMN_006022 [Dreissena polymorpha]|uniref:Uncharacterized protein n=1 Tax=Dreissena polymorpha TaxID=45954 RepID=A0A9D4RUG6_DREPO|nr:hypothetical protein DPMN_006022 [Dreissena polymorpha]
MFLTNRHHFELVKDIIGMNLLTKFHEDWILNVASRMLTRFYYSHIEKNAPPPGSHVLQPTGIIFKLIEQYMKNAPPLVSRRSEIILASTVLTGKNALLPGDDVFQPTGIIFELIQDIIDQRIHVASREKNAPPLGSHTNLRTKFHEDWTINVASGVKNIPAPWQPYIISKNLLTEFHEDRKINVASRVLTKFYYSHRSIYPTDCFSFWAVVKETHLPNSKPCR